MKNLKLQKHDVALFIGFVFCCIVIVYLSWSVSEPIKDIQYSNTIVWSNTGVECYSHGRKWPAINGVCYMEDAR